MPRLLSLSTRVFSTTPSSFVSQNLTLSPSQTTREGVEMLSKYGAVVIPSGLPQATVGQWRDACTRLVLSYTQLADRRGGLKMEKKGGFRELVHKDVGRFDVNLDHVAGLRAPATWSPSVDEKVVHGALLHAKVRIRAITNATLGTNHVLNGFGFVLSKPGTAAQNWHIDSSHLFQPSDFPGPLPPALPWHFFTVFVPLFDPLLEIGPTEMALGSHRYTDVLSNQVVEDQYPPSPVVSSILQNRGVFTEKVLVTPGDVIIMDGRILHRGLENSSGFERPLLYMSFCRPWYTEFPKSHHESRSLFASD